MAVSPIGLAALVQQGFDQGTKRREESGLRSLMGDYYSGKVAPQQSGAFLGEVARLGGDPGPYRQDMAMQEKARQQKLGSMASMLLSAPEPFRADLYRSLVPELRNLGFANPPPEYTPQIDGLVREIARMHGGESFKPMSLSPGAEVWDPASGKVVHQNKNFAPTRPAYDSWRGGWAMPPDAQPGNGPDFNPGNGYNAGSFVPVASPRVDYEGQRMDLARAANDRAERAAADAAEARRLAQRGNPPAGYRWNADGTALEPIPGGPVNLGKPLPSPVVNKLTNQANIYTNTADLLSRFSDDFAGNVMGGGVENLAGRLGGESIGIATPGQADWWQAYDRQKNVIRNELFGSALTPSEQRAFEQADVNPNMAPERIRANLRTQMEIASKALQRQAEVWKKQGFNTAAIDAAVMPSLSTDAQAPQPPRPPAQQQRAREGDVVENKQTGERRQLRGGQWVRIN